MLSEILEKTKLRKNFYRDCYFRALSFLIFTFVVIVILLLMIVLLAANRGEHSYYATSNSGIITPLNALTQPNYSSTPLIE